MNKATFVVFFGLYAASVQASDLHASISGLESEWTVAYYQKNEEEQKQIYSALLEKAADLVKRHPEAAEPKIWYATIMTTNAGLQSSLAALSAIDNAKALLEQAIKINPRALDGAAYVTLGTLYYKVPAWPVSFGDNQIAEQLLKASLGINPDGIDANYFYADFLLQQDREIEAENYFHKAMEAPIRKHQAFADTQLKNEARQALEHVRLKKLNAGSNSRFMSLFATATYADK